MRVSVLRNLGSPGYHGLYRGGFQQLLGAAGIVCRERGYGDVACTAGCGARPTHVPPVVRLRMVPAGVVCPGVSGDAVLQLCSWRAPIFQVRVVGFVASPESAPAPLPGI